MAGESSEKHFRNTLINKSGPLEARGVMIIERMVEWGLKGEENK